MPGLSLNGVRAFESAARQRSFKAAAEELGVTPSAVSHQVRLLEDSVGSRLFARRHNAVELTPEGARFFNDISPAISAIAGARLALQRDASEIVVRVPGALGCRWLIPRLTEFRDSHPDLRVRLETGNSPGAFAPDVDIAISYVAAGDAINGAAPTGEPLLVERVCPLAAPALVEQSPGKARGDWRENLARLPIILSSTVDHANWQGYCRLTGMDPDALRIAGRFDTDHAAIEACLAGLGVFIPALAFMEEHVRQGRLVPVQDCPAVVLGSFHIRAATTPPRRAATSFLRWLRRQAAGATQ